MFLVIYFPAKKSRELMENAKNGQQKEELWVSWNVLPKYPKTNPLKGAIF
jgi:hypothetical protein